MSLPVVYVDDERSLCRVFEMILGARGVPIVTFTDATEAVAYLTANAVAIVFCDYRMPKLSGLDVLAQMGQSVPFYLVSGDLDAAGCANVAGVTGVLAKPFRAEALIALVAEHLDPTP